jgi:hypothetical protein
MKRRRGERIIPQRLINNPYGKKNKHNTTAWKQNSEKQQELGNRSSLNTYLEIAKDWIRKTNKYSLCRKHVIYAKNIRLRRINENCQRERK